MGNEGGVFWTFCPYCYYVYCYDNIYEGCCLKCQNVECRRAFHGVSIGSLSGKDLDKDESFRCYGYFPLGLPSSVGGSNSKLENWSPIVGLFPIEKVENTCPNTDVNNVDVNEVLDESDELEQDVFSGEKRKVVSRKKMVPKKLRTRRRKSDEGGSNVVGDGLDFNGDGDGDVAGGSGYGHGGENMDLFGDDDEVYMRFGDDDGEF